MSSQRRSSLRFIEKNNLGISNVSKPNTRETPDYYTLYQLLTCRIQLNINLFYFVSFDCNISYYNRLKIKKEVFVFLLQSFLITLINLGAQIWGAQTWYTTINFGINQPEYLWVIVTLVDKIIWNIPLFDLPWCSNKHQNCATIDFLCGTFQDGGLDLLW